MRIFNEIIEHLSEIIIFIAGKNDKENHILVNDSLSNDLWFHVADYPSAHLVAQIDNKDLTKDELGYIIKRGACLLKSISKQKNINKLEIQYTYIKNIEITEPIGSVLINEHKSIFI